ncbi:MAG: undecaprenyl/decaprenyl-phosphate alpha-N-acetylglucosaminyl 1-phosphate transferase [Magnetococcus sp. YQC-5]
MNEWPLRSIVTAWTVTTVLLIVIQPFARHVGWVDHPGPRKLHVAPTPLIGGVAMFIGFTLALMQMEMSWIRHEGIILGCGVCLIVGYLDDMHNIRAYLRFIIEWSLALWLSMGYGLEIHTLGDLFGLGEVVLGRWSILFTTISIVGLINAINMSDGLDGVAGGQSLVSFVWMIMMAGLAERWMEGQILLMFVVVLVAFLYFNAPIPLLGRSSARIFMGDAGSMFLGLGLVWFAIMLSQGTNPAMTPTTALWMVAVPLIDMFSIMFRRLLRGDRLFAPDLGHMHHIVLKMGFGKGAVCLIMMGLSALFGLCGAGGQWMGIPEAMMFYLWVVALVLYCWFGIYYCERHQSCANDSVKQ